MGILKEMIINIKIHLFILNNFNGDVVLGLSFKLFDFSYHLNLDFYWVVIKRKENTENIINYKLSINL